MIKLFPSSRFALDANRQELFAYSVFRAFQAGMVSWVVVGPGQGWFGETRHDFIGPWICIAYLLFSLVMLGVTRSNVKVVTQVAIGTVIDIFFANAAIRILPDASPIIAIMLLLNVAASSLLVSMTFGLATAALAGATFILQGVINQAIGSEYAVRPIAESFVFAAAFIATALFANSLARRVVKSEEVAKVFSEEARDLAAINEVIIRRMPTGVIIVDGDGYIQLANEAAIALLGQAGEGLRALALSAPNLSDRLELWRQYPTVKFQESDNYGPIRMGPDQLEIVPKFLRLHADSEDDVVIFLDDTTIASRRAEGITLSALGRFSASLAHEIRNPLSAISYSTQLLEESRDLSVMDRKMLEIVRQQVTRVNGIIESVLGLARRERALPEPVQLGDIAKEFAEEYVRSYPLDADVLKVDATVNPMAMADPRHIHQILQVLISNARYYGRKPGEPAKMTIRAFMAGNTPMLSVIDQGPGISDKDQVQLFRPFHTTSPHGTGLGLHIARELARSNGGDLRYKRTGVGSVFELSLPDSLALRKT
ncbi:PAS domain-containing protein [Lysobacter sp. HDW10]|uniref:sensor histidine kinase n=1 Tax=Lysobacter sp. HDW10 TaxID=2714936 RepID=UPI001408BB78|nr:ATP-binding protein [Lysobacter sp. HDW10]QIK80334.1 PAS domain-containing protein [Lysobacter sp. HDW10]